MVSGGVMRFSRRTKEIYEDKSGQILVFVLSILFVLVLFWLLLPNVSAVTVLKMRAQTAADAGAYTGSVWLARGLNLITCFNIGIRHMYMWILSLTIICAIVLTLVAISGFFSPAFGIAQVICLALGWGDPNNALAAYREDVKNLYKSAQWLSEREEDIARIFPILAVIDGSRIATINMGGFRGIGSQGGFCIILPMAQRREPLSIQLKEDKGALLQFLSDYAGALSGEGPNFGENFGEGRGGVSIDDELNVGGNFSQKVMDKFKVKQYFERYVAKARQIYTKPSYPETITAETREFEIPEEESELAKYIGDPPLIYLRPDLINLGYSAVGIRIDLPPKQSSPETRWFKVPEEEEEGKKYLTPPSPPERLLLPVNGWRFVRAEKIPNWREESQSADPDEETKRMKKPVPKKIDPDYKPYSVSFVYRVKTPALVAKTIFTEEKIGPPFPGLAFSKAMPYLPAHITDSVFSPEWDAKIVPFIGDAVEKLLGEDEYQRNRGDIDLQSLVRYLILH